MIILAYLLLFNYSMHCFIGVKSTDQSNPRSDCILGQEITIRTYVHFGEALPQSRYSCIRTLNIEQPSQSLYSCIHTLYIEYHLLVQCQKQICLSNFIFFYKLCISHTLGILILALQSNYVTIFQHLTSCESLKIPHHIYDMTRL